MDNGEKKICKITDFGLSRNIVIGGAYVKTTSVSACDSLGKCTSGVCCIASSVFKLLPMLNVPLKNKYQV